MVSFHDIVLSKMQAAGMKPVGEKGDYNIDGYMMPFSGTDVEAGVVHITASGIELLKLAHDENALADLADVRCRNAIRTYRENTEA